VKEILIGLTKSETKHKDVIFSAARPQEKNGK
jgi:hypothetical protein